MNPLDQFKNMPKEPSFGDKEKIEQDNQEYNKPLNKSLEEQKKELMESLYGVKDKKENEEIVPQEEKWISPEEMHEDILNNTKAEKEIQEEYHNSLPDYSDTGLEEDYLKNNSFNENKDMVEGGNDFGAEGIPEGENFEQEIEKKENDYKESLLENNNTFKVSERLFETKQISRESFENIMNYIDKNDGEIDIDKVDIEDSEKDLLKGLGVNLEGENKHQNKIDFGNDIKNIEEFKDFDKSIEDGNFVNSEGSFNVLNKIGENYIKIPDKENNIDPRKDISTAIEITKNNILKEVKNIPKDSQTYKTAISNIKSGNLEQQIQGINSLGNLAYSIEGKIAKKEHKDIYKEQRKEELKKSAIELTKELKKAKDANDNKRIKELEEEKQKIIDEANEIESGDIFEGGKNEKINDNDPLSALEQA